MMQHHLALERGDARLAVAPAHQHGDEIVDRTLHVARRGGGAEATLDRLDTLEREQARELVPGDRAGAGDAARQKRGGQRAERNAALEHGCGPVDRLQRQPADEKDADRGQSEFDDRPRARLPWRQDDRQFRRRFGRHDARGRVGGDDPRLRPIGLQRDNVALDLDHARAWTPVVILAARIAHRRRSPSR